MQDSQLIVTEAAEKTLLYDDKTKRIPVCAYCRVSTDKSDQKNSFESQKKFFEYEFTKHENWYGKTVFADEGISGTSLHKRDMFNKMISEALDGKYKLIITKEVSRFSRNLQDILNLVVELREMGVYIYFMTEEINTESPDYREKLNTYGNQAEAESAKTSKRVKWGQRRQMEAGVVFGRCEMYGYNIVRNENGKQKFVVVPEEAEIVRRIFTMYDSGWGTFKIARKLEGEGIKTKRYKNGWSNIVILRMLRNEKYVGDLTTGKTYTPNFLSHKKKYNRGESALVSIQNHHPNEAIIDRDLWDRVQRRLQESSPSEAVKAKHSNRYWCSGKVYCGNCGQRYVSHIKKLKNGTTYKAWKCWESQQRGSYKERIFENGEKRMVGCDSESVNDKVLLQGMHDIITQILQVDFQRILEESKNGYNDSQTSFHQSTVEDLEKRASEINEKLGQLTISLIDGKISEVAYKAASSKLENELQELNDQIADCMTEGDTDEAQQLEAKQYYNTLDRIANLENSEINEELYKELIKRIEVYDNHILKYYFYGLSEPFVMRYTARGRLDKYTVDFELIDVDTGELIPT